MAFNYGQFGGGFGANDDDYMSAFGDSAQSFKGLYGDETTNALESNRRQRQEGMAQLASGSIQQIGQREQALAYAKGWQEQADRERRAQKAKQRGGFLGGLFNVAGAAASFIPGAGPFISAGLKAVGSGFG